MKWPLFFKDNLMVGNPKSQVGICTLWTDKNYIAKNISKEKFGLCGNLYTAEGINYIDEVEKLKKETAKPFTKPVIIKETNEDAPDLYTEEQGFVLKGEKVSEVWPKILNLIMKFGEEKESEYKLKQKKILNLVSIVENNEKTEKEETTVSVSAHIYENNFEEALIIIETALGDKVLPYLVSLLDHAAYLGHELARAEECLKTGKKFIQDKT